MLDTTLALLIFLFPFTYSPGPGNIFFAVNGARFGVKSTINANIGYHVANWLICICIGLGFLQIFENYPLVYKFLKLAGSIYILWISWKILKSSNTSSRGEATSATFKDGVFIFVLNPKAYLSISLVYSQFLALYPNEMIFSVILIATIFTLNNFVAFLLWSLFGEYVFHYFDAPEHRLKINVFFCGVLALVAIWILLI